MEQDRRPDPTAAAAAMRSDGAAAPSRAAAAPPLKRDRHIVTWSQQEDDLLRDQVAIHGTDNWTIIAAQFNDKTGRQCRRRWYTYLNSECKKGGWSPEEDMILCEAQKMFGNRWTEIAKVVSGRTDNAVKNRFSTLCKKRAKHESSSKENVDRCANPYSKRVIIENGRVANCIEETSASTRQIRYHVTDLKESRSVDKGLTMQHGMRERHPRPPLAVLAQNFDNAGGLENHILINNSTKADVHDVSSNRIRNAFLRRDDPKLAALFQQADMLSSLATKVNTENSKQSLEDAWKELQDYLIQTEETGSLSRKISGMDFLLDDFKDLIEDMRSVNTESPLQREGDIHEESQVSSESQTRTAQHLSTQQNGSVQEQADDCLLYHNIEIGALHENMLIPSINSGQDTQVKETIQPPIHGCSLEQNAEISAPCEDMMCTGFKNGQDTQGNDNVQQLATEHDDVEISCLLEDMPCPGINGSQDVLSSSQEVKDGDENISTLPASEFCSPLQTMPIFRSLTEGPSPKFSASERQFLLSVFGLSSPGSAPNSIQQPSCKRTLLDSLTPRAI